MIMTQHRSPINTKQVDQPVAQHFNSLQHSMDNLRVIAIDQNDNWSEEVS